MVADKSVIAVGTAMSYPSQTKKPPGGGFGGIVSDDQFWRIVIGAAVVAAIPYIWKRDKSLTEQAEQPASEDRHPGLTHRLGYRLGKLWSARK